MTALPLNLEVVTLLGVVTLVGWNTTASASALQIAFGYVARQVFRVATNRRPVPALIVLVSVCLLAPVVVVSGLTER